MTAVKTSLDVSVSKAEMLRMLAVCNRIANKRSSIEITKSVRLTATPTGLTLQVISDEGQATLSCNPFVVGDGDVCVNVPLLIEAVDAMLDADISLTEKDNQLLVSQDKRMSKLPTMDPQDFPAMTTPKGLAPCPVTVIAMREGCKSVDHALGIDFHRQALLSVLLTAAGGIARYVATDTHRLSVYQSAGGDGFALIPAVLVREIAEAPDAAVLEFGDTMFRLTYAGTEIAGMLGQGTYPNFERVIPESSVFSICVQTSAAKEIIARIAKSQAARDNALRVVCTVGEDGLNFRAFSPNYGSMDATIDYVGSGPIPNEFSFALNSKFLLDALTSCPEDSVRMELTEHTRPVLFKAAGNENWLEVIMPMQLRGGE